MQFYAIFKLIIAAIIFVLGNNLLLLCVSQT